MDIFDTSDFSSEREEEEEDKIGKFEILMTPRDNRVIDKRYVMASMGAHNSINK